MDLDKITPSVRVGTRYPVEDWVAEIRSEGFVVIPIYHNTKQSEDEFKAQSVRSHLAKAFGKVYYMSGRDEDTGSLVYVLSNRVAVFKEREWSYETETAQKTENDGA